MDKKYRLTDETIQHCDNTLYRIEALRDFKDVKKGDKGGFIESEKNLSHAYNCWIYGNAKVFDNAIVRDNACVYDNAEVYSNAVVYEEAIVAMNAVVYDRASIGDDAYISNYARIYDSARVFDSATISGNAKVFGNAEVYGDACIRGYADIFDDATICGCALICNGSRVYEEAIVSDNAVIMDNSNIHGKVKVDGMAYIIDADISRMDDYLVFKNWWSSGRYFTWTKSNNMWRVGCFYGTGEELIAKAYKDSELSGREYKRIVRYVESINQPTKKLNCIQRIVRKLFNIK